MMPRRRYRKRFFRIGRQWLVLVWLVFLNACWAETVTLHLRNGDRITGEMISLSVDKVTITNKVLGKIGVPITQVERMEKKSAEPSAAKPTNAPPALAPATNQPAVAPATPPPPAAAPASKPAAATAKAPPTQPPAVKPKPVKHWTIDAQLGADLQYNQSERQLYYGRAKWTYGRDRFRSIVDYLVNYGKTDGLVAANDMTGSVRVELDVGKSKRLFVFNAAGSGYNEIRKIDFSYDDSFGLGYKLLSRTNLTLSTDLGVNYQQQYFSDGTNKDYGAMRLGELLSWKISPRWIFDGKYEFYPRVTDIGEYRMRLESNLRYLLSTSINLNLTVIDQYDTQPAGGVTRNDVLLRATLGLKF
jgi:opacity protein-like surface antigen